MFTGEQYRAKAIEYGNLVSTSASDHERREYQKLEQKFAELADNQEWLAEHHQQTLHAAGTKVGIEPPREEGIRNRAPSVVVAFVGIKSALERRTDIGK